ncbi:MAG: helix-turn-helix domain-containing protein [Armatimonadetes bacterium]|nr:helix-turn-helix domain-containing protein [Armatimonadota bacterium]
MGWEQKEITVALGVTPGAVSRWLKRAKESGLETLRHPPRGALRGAHHNTAGLTAPGLWKSASQAREGLRRAIHPQPGRPEDSSP